MHQLSQRGSYTIPVVMKTIDILEHMRRSQRPLKMDCISQQTKIARSTTYRILRTLVSRGYLTHRHDGSYSYTATTDQVGTVGPLAMREATQRDEA